MFPLAAELGDFDSFTCKADYLTQVELMPRLVSLLHCDSSRITGPLPFPLRPVHWSSRYTHIIGETGIVMATNVGG